MSKKKLIITITSCVVATGLVVSAVWGVSAARKNSKTVDVYSVMNLNAGYYSDSLESEGTVTSDSAQSVYLETTQKITEIYVKEGDTVAAGDKLMALDLTSLNLSIEIKKLNVEAEEYQLDGLEKEYAELQKKKVGDPKYDTNTATASGTVLPATCGIPATAQSEVSSEDYPEELADLNDLAEAESGSGTDTDPFLFVCQDTTTVSGALLNQLLADGYCAEFNIYDDGTSDGILERSLFVNGSTLPGYEDTDVISLFLTKQPQENGSEENEEGESEEGESEEGESEEGESEEGENEENGSEENGGEEYYDPNDYYTAEELQKALRDKKQEVSEADLALRKDKLALEQMQEEAGDGFVYAKINGTVKTIHEADAIPTDGSAFLTVLGSDGMYIRGGIDEMHLDQVQVGTIVNAYDYETGNYMEGTIASIDDFPSTDVYCYSSENPNTSTYAYTAYFEDVEELSVGQWVDLTIAQDDSSSSDAIYIDKAYVRKDDSGSYVYKEADGRLVRQAVSTGQYLWGEYVEIKDGITLEDYIAFPYGDAEEGIKCQESEEIDYGY